MFQQLTIAGHLGSDCELRYTPDGAAVAIFRNDSTEQWKK